MKKKNLLVLMCLFMAMLCTTTFTSCSDDDDDDSSPASLVGTWKSVSGSMGDIEFPFDDKDYMLLVITDKTITDKTFTDGAEETSETSTFDYTVKGNTIYAGSEKYADFSISGSNLTLTYSEMGVTVKTVYKRQ